MKRTVLFISFFCAFFQVPAAQTATITAAKIATSSNGHLQAGWGGSSAVASVFGRTGIITAQRGDYTAAQVGADAAGAAALHARDLQKANNLSDFASAATARTSLGLGAVAVQPATAFDAAETAQTNAEAFSANGSNITSGSIYPNYTSPSVISTSTSSGEWPLDDGSGTTARDITGNGNALTLSGATWIPGAGVSCMPAINGTPQVLISPLASYGTVMIAFSPWTNGPINTATPLTTGSGETNPANTSPTLIGSTVSTSGFLMYGVHHGTAFAPNGARAIGGTLYANAEGFGAGAGGMHVLTHVVSASADLYYLDGQLWWTASAGSSAYNAITGGTYEFCGFAGLGSNGFRGTLYYAKMWPSGTALTAAQVLQESNRIAQIVNNRPAVPKLTTTYVNVPAPTVVAIGDSQLAGAPSSTPWFSSTYITPVNSYTYTNTGIFGETDRDLALNPIHWLQAFPNAGAKIYCPITSSANDVANGNAASVQYAHLVMIAQQCIAHGGIPLLTTTVDRSGESSGIATLDAYIRATALQAGQPFAALIDYAELPVFSPSGTNYSNRACYQSDGTHLTGPGAGTCYQSLGGYSLFALAYTRVLNEMDGSTAAVPDQTTSNAFGATDLNNYVVQTPTAAATYQLVDCNFITGQRKKVINGSSGFSITVTTTNSETVLGPTVIAPNASATFTAMVTSTTAGGCSWLSTN